MTYRACWPATLLHLRAALAVAALPLASVASMAPLALLGLVTPSQAAVVISQVYGGGGNTGATFKNDFIELFNAGNTPESIGGWSVQYSTAAGSTWQLTPIPAGTTLAAGRYLLIQQAAGSGGSVDLPTPDVIGTLAMSGTNGKVVLSSSSAALAGTAPSGGTVIDAISYGTGTPTEGSATPALSNTTAALRNGNGCTDSQVNSADFSLGAPNPRSGATPAAVCTGGGGVTPPLAAAIYTIQGTGAASALVGTKVITSGVVTRRNSNGFFMQDPVGDNNPATSDGIFVLIDPALSAHAQVGNLVQVTGVVTEFIPGAGTTASPLTELTAVSAITVQGSGYSITPTLLSLPLAAGDSFERFEGMLVRIDSPMTVQQNFFQARFGQITIGAGGRHENPTNRYRAGTAQAIALADLQARSRLLLDDGSSLQNPNPTPYAGSNGQPRAGDALGTITGVIDFGPATSTASGAGLYRIHPTTAVQVQASNPRPATPPAVGGNVRVASMNVLNFFTTFLDGNTASGLTGQGCTLGGATAASNCRGANNAAEFARQRSKIVQALAGLNADVVGLMEIQNNGSTAVQNLVDALNAQVGAGLYAAVPDPGTVNNPGTGTDAIKVAMIYKPARLARQGNAASDTTAINNRPPLAQTFAAPNGERFTLVVNHLKSKGGCPAAGVGNAADADLGDGQGCWNATRLAQVRQLRSFVAQLQGSSGSNDVLLIGDFNAYGQEDPIIDLTSSGYADQMGRFSPLAYSYVFDGTAGRLDHGISTATLSPKVVGAAHWHIDADESTAQDYNLEFKQPACAACAPDPFDGSTPFRASDHDPAVLGLNLYKTITAAPGSTAVVGSAGDDIILSGAGRRTLTGGAGNDQFVFVAGFAGGATVTDFAPGADTLSLRAVLQGLRITSTDPIGQGYVLCTASGADALISIDPDAAGPAVPRPMILIKNQGCAVLAAGNFVF